MKKNNVKRVILVLALVSVIGIGGSLAYFTDTDTKSNTVTMGNVNGTLSEIKDNVILDPTATGFEYTGIKPGDQLDKEPFVTLGDNSEDAYVRIKVEITNESSSITETIKEEIINNLSGTESGWVKNGKYYYYQTPLTQTNKETTKAFKTVVIPGNWGNELKNFTFQISLTAELVQSSNVDEELERNDANQIIGWGQIKVEANE